MLGLVAFSLLALAPPKTDPLAEVRRRIAAADAAYSHRNLKASLSFFAPDVKFYDNTGKLISKDYVFEQAKRSIEQTSSIKAKTTILKGLWNGRIAQMSVKSDVREVIAASGTIYDSSSTSIDLWARVNGVFKMIATQITSQREWLNGVRQHGGTIR